MHLKSMAQTHLFKLKIGFGKANFFRHRNQLYRLILQGSAQQAGNRRTIAFARRLSVSISVEMPCSVLNKK